ncbi:MAG: hypothetical protein D6765_01905 [Bacteroidetes bacterium]|nr:MAG: hypothetical protein D6765_01905 [Bacteroidota bacterium]
MSRHAGFPTPFWLYFLGLALLTWSVRHHAFFWDTVQLASKHAHHFFEQGFWPPLLPDALDSGHPPTFGAYLAAVWLLFGKTLPVSHLAMLPFLGLLLWAMLRIGRHLPDPRWGKWLPLLLFADPVLAAQSLLVSPDVALAAFFLLGVVGLLEGRSLWVGAAVLGLGLISLRGMMVGLGLYLWALLLLPSPGRMGFGRWIRAAGRQLLPFLPGGLLGVAFLSWHYAEKGWVGYHPDSPWAGSFAAVDARGLLRNVAVVGWRWLDFGRVFLLAAVAGLLGCWWRQRQPLPAFARRMLLLWGCMVLVLTPTMLLYKGLSAHRYLLPAFLSFSLIFAALLTVVEGWRRGALFALVFAGLVTGNLWIYPRHISQGWDSTLAHLPWYGLRNEAISFLDQAGVPLDSVGTVFPAIGPLEWYDLNGRSDGFARLDWKKHRRVLYANIMNDFTDEELRTLETSWEVWRRWERGGVCLVLYRR